MARSLLESDSLEEAARVAVKRPPPSRAAGAPLPLPLPRGWWLEAPVGAPEPPRVRAIGGEAVGGLFEGAAVVATSVPNGNWDLTAGAQRCARKRSSCDQLQWRENRRCRTENRLLPN